MVGKGRKRSILMKWGKMIFWHSYLVKFDCFLYLDWNKNWDLRVADLIGKKIRAM